MGISTLEPRYGRDIYSIGLLIRTLSEKRTCDSPVLFSLSQDLIEARFYKYLAPDGAKAGWSSVCGLVLACNERFENN